MKSYKYHYVYRITNIVENMHYYGVHSCNCEPKYDIGVKYFSSSTVTEFISDQKRNRANYKYKIIKLFPTREEANQYELKLLYKFKANINKKFYNRAIYCNNSLHSDTTNMMTVYNTIDNKFIRVHHNDYINNEHFKTVWELSTNKEKVTCFNLDNNMYLSIDKKLFDNSPNLVGVNYGKISGSDNPNANIVRVFNHKHELIYTFNGNFNKSSNISIPYPAFSISYKNGGKPLGLSKQSRTELRKNCFQSFIGWYALLNNNHQDFNETIDFDIELEQKTGLFCVLTKGRCKGRAHKWTKTYTIEHNNEIYTMTGGFEKFCKEHNISPRVLKNHRGKFVTLEMIGSNHRYERVKNTIGWKLYNE